LTTVKLPKSLKSIEEGAFSFCEKLKDIKLPNSLTKIGEYAFLDCKVLTNISVPKSVTSIGKSAFTNTPWIKLKVKKSPLVIVNHIVIDGVGCKGDVVIPDHVTTIGEEAFSAEAMGPSTDNLDGIRSIEITSVTIPASVNKIEDKAFFCCNKLSSVKIKGSDITIGNAAFCECRSLEDITFPSIIKSIGSFAFSQTRWLDVESKKNPLVIVGNILIDGDACSDKVVVPDFVTTITDYAFSSNYEVTDFTIPSSVTNIGDNAFNEFINNVISGNEGSYAQKYAKEHNITFKMITEE
jgi:hypothetical protein